MPDRVSDAVLFVAGPRIFLAEGQTVKVTAAMAAEAGVVQKHRIVYLARVSALASVCGDRPYPTLLWSEREPNFPIHPGDGLLLGKVFV